MGFGLDLVTGRTGDEVLRHDGDRPPSRQSATRPRKASVINLSSIPAQSCVDATLSAGSALITDIVLVTPPPDLPAGAIVGTRQASSNGQIVVRACNVGSSACANHQPRQRPTGSLRLDPAYERFVGGMA